MVHAKNCDIASTFVKVMQKKTVALFFSGHGVYIAAGKRPQCEPVRTQEVQGCSQGEREAVRTRSINTEQ